MGVAVTARARTTARVFTNLLAVLNLTVVGRFWWAGLPTVASFLFAADVGLLALTFYLLSTIPAMRVYEEARDRIVLAERIGMTGQLLITMAGTLSTFQW